MNTPKAPEIEFQEIYSEINSRNPDRRAYLSRRGVLKGFYIGDAAIEMHFREVAKLDAQETLAARQQERKSTESAYRTALCKYQNLLEEIRQRINEGENYLTFDLDSRACIEDIYRWITDEPIDRWTEWHLMAAEFITGIPKRGASLALAKGSSTNVSVTRQWEHLTITAKLKGANWGLMSTFLEHGLEDSAANKLHALGREGWEVAATAPIVYGAAGATGSAVLIILKRRVI